MGKFVMLTAMTVLATQNPSMSHGIRGPLGNHPLAAWSWVTVARELGRPGPGHRQCGDDPAIFEGFTEPGITPQDRRE